MRWKTLKLKAKSNEKKVNFILRVSILFSMDAINSKITESITSVVNEHFQAAVSDYIVALKKQFPDLDKGVAMKLWNEMAPPTLNVNKASVTKKRRKAPKGTGTVSGYNMFTKMERPQIVEQVIEENPDIMVTDSEGNEKADPKRLFPLVSRAMGVAWRELDEQGKKRYLDMATDENSRRSDVSGDETESPSPLPTQTKKKSKKSKKKRSKKKTQVEDSDANESDNDVPTSGSESE